LAVCAWLACDNPRPWQVKYLLEPICREGRLPGMGNEADYLMLARNAGFALAGVEDLSARVSRTWRVCAGRILRGLATRPHYRKFLMDKNQPNRIFALTLFRLLAAYRTGSMRYCLLTFTKPSFVIPHEGGGSTTSFVAPPSTPSLRGAERRSNPSFLQAVWNNPTS
jgi:tocopherol O-methyltransferase